MIKNIPSIKIGVVAVSRNCFPEELSVNRRKALVESYKELFDEESIYECPVCIVESELHMQRALKDVIKAGCNALCIYLGNFGPEIAESMLAQNFDGPKMICAASEESRENLVSNRGDAYCGMLNASYSLNMRKTRVFIPENPVGNAKQCANLIHEFIPVARAVIGLKNLKVISFGPRPQNFMACNAPIQPLYDLGVEIEENSELDLLESFNKHAGDSRISDVVDSMKEELGAGNNYPEMLEKFAQYELTIRDWIRTHKGSKKYVAIASKCWPAFQTQFGFVPCYVNSRLTGEGIPVACEVDIYGCLSEYIGTCISGDVVTLLDINNTVPEDLYSDSIKGVSFRDGEYKSTDVFMGFHCGNTNSRKLNKPNIKHQEIMARMLPKEITIGTIEGDIVSDDVTMIRLQGGSDSKLRSYIAEGEVLPVGTETFGSTGIIGIHEMERFYRHVLIEKHYPHHGVLVFGLYGDYIYELMKYIGIELEEIDYNHPISERYSSENPFKRKRG